MSAYAESFIYHQYRREESDERGEWLICECGNRFWMSRSEGYVMRPLCNRCVNRDIQKQRIEQAKQR